MRPFRISTRMAKMQPIMTEAMKAEYLTNGGTLCPFCGSLNISAGFFEADGPEGTQDVHCVDCGARWYDVYTMTGVGE